MINVLILDDEIFIREHIKRCIDWGKHGFRIAEEAENGIEALHILETESIELIIMDINMPHMDGLEFACRCKELYPHISFCVISGYNNFDYVKSAIKLGVEDYLLKPVEEEELLVVLNKVKKKINDRKSFQRDLETMNRTLRLIEAEKKNNFFNTFIEKGIWGDKDEFIHAFTGSFSNLPYENALVLLMDIDGIDLLWEKDQEKKLWQFVVTNIAEEIISKQYKCVAVSDKEGIIAILIGINDKTQLIYDKLLAKCYKIANFVKEHYQFSVSIALGDIHKGVNGFRKSYLDALLAYESRLVFDNTKVITYAKVNQKAKITHLLSDFRQETLIALRLMNQEMVHQAIDVPLSWLKANHSSVKELITLMNEFIVCVTEFLVEYNLDVNTFISKEFTVKKILKDATSFKAIESWFEELTSHIIERVSGNRKSDQSLFVMQAKAYIDEHFTEKNLCLDIVAVNVSVNSAYLSSTFKKELGISVVEYLTDRRMHYAKQLINRDQYSLQDISAMVGYKDPYYFSKCFKRFFGISASKYIRNNVSI